MASGKEDVGTGGRRRLRPCQAGARGVGRAPACWIPLCVFRFSTDQETAPAGWSAWGSPVRTGALRSLPGVTGRLGPGRALGCRSCQSRAVDGADGEASAFFIWPSRTRRNGPTARLESYAASGRFLGTRSRTRPGAGTKGQAEVSALAGSFSRPRRAPGCRAAARPCRRGNAHRQPWLPRHRRRAGRDRG